jgi:hypothetical protein
MHVFMLVLGIAIGVHCTHDTQSTRKAGREAGREAASELQSCRKCCDEMRP